MAYYIDKTNIEKPESMYKRDFVFPGGEVHVEVASNVMGRSPMWFRLRNSDDIMRMLLTADAIKRRGSLLWDAVIPYLPYARQDRVAVEGEPLSIAVMANLINSCGFSRVALFDPHSDVSTALINNVVVLDNKFVAFKAWLAFKADAIACPDAGARKKIGALKFGPVVYCDKKRDPKTGSLSGFEVHQSDVPESVLIVDDICDGGGTFIGLAQELRSKGAKRVGLFVSHGIFSKGLDCLREGGIDHVFTTDSYCTLPSDEFLTVYPLSV